MEIFITKVSPIDIKTLQQISMLTFREAFLADNDENDIDKYISENFSIIKLSEELNNDNSEFYFATFEDNTIGYLKINSGTAQTELQHENSLEIERIYVVKEFYGKNAGQMLFNKSIEIAKMKNVEYVWLGVWEKNLRAINFYKKNGFVPFNKHIFKLGNDEQTDVMMKLNLK